MSGLLDLVSKYEPEVDPALAELSSLEKLIMDEEKRRKEEEEERLRLLKIQEEKEAQRKADEVEAARLNVEDLTFEDVKDVLREKESGGDDNAEFVNDDKTKDTGRYQINERWVNQNPTAFGEESYALNADGSPDTVYNSIHDAMIEQIPQWDTIDDNGRRLMLRIPEINEQIANIIYDTRGGPQFSSWGRVVDSLQTQFRSASVDSMAANALQGNNPTLDEIAQKINLDTTAISESTFVSPENIEASLVSVRRTEAFGEEWAERLARAEEHKGFEDAVGAYISNPVKLLPFLGSSPDIAKIVDLTDTVNRINKAEEDGVEPDQDDMLKLYEWQLNNRSEKGWGYTVGSILGELPSFAGEIYLTGGTYTAGKKFAVKAGKEALEYALGKGARKKVTAWIAKKGVLNKTAKFSSKAASSIIGATRQAAKIEVISEGLNILPTDWAKGGRIREGTLDRMMGELPISENERGDLEASIFIEGDDFGEAFGKSVTDYWIELVSERSGGALKIFKGVGSKGREIGLRFAITKKMLDLNPKKTLKEVTDFQKRVGWNGIFGEMFEERVGETARGAAFELGMDEPGWKGDKGIFKIPSLEQLSAEFVAFLIPQSGFMAVNTLRNRQDDGSEDGTKPLSFDPNNQEEVRSVLKANGFTVDVVENEGKYDVNVYVGDELFSQSIGHKDKKAADNAATSWEKELTHHMNAATVEFEDKRPPMAEGEGTTVEAKPWFSKEADAIREKIRQTEEASDLSRAVPTSEDITENLEKIYGSVETVEEDVVEEKVNYNIMNTKRLRQELRDKGKSDKGSKRALIARLEVEVTRPDIKKGVLSELNDRSAKLTRLQEKIKEEIKYENELSVPDPARLEVLNKDLAVAVSQKDRVVQDIHKIQGVKPKVKTKPKKAAPAVEAPVVTPAEDVMRPEKVKQFDTAKYERYKAKLEKGEKLNSMEAAEWDMFLEAGFADVTPTVADAISTEEEAPAAPVEAPAVEDTRTPAEIEAENIRLQEELGVIKPKKVTTKAIPPQGLAPVEEVEVVAAPKKIVFTGKNKTSQADKANTIQSWLSDKGMDKAGFIKDFMALAPSKTDRGKMSRAEYKDKLSKEYDSAIENLDTAEYNQILEKTKPTHVDKKGKKHDFTELDNDDIVYLNGSFGLTPEMLDAVGKGLVDTGRFVYDTLSPAMQKLGNKLGINKQNFKLKYAQFKNNAKDMTAATKKWFKQVIGNMRTWFRKNSKNLLESKPVQQAYKRLENMVTYKAVPEGMNFLEEMRAKVEANLKEEGKLKPSETIRYKKIRRAKIKAKKDNGDGVGGWASQLVSLLSDRLKNVKGGMGVLRALRRYEEFTLNVEKDLIKTKPWFKFMKKIMPYKSKTVGVGKFKKTFIVPTTVSSKQREDWNQLEAALLRGDQEAILQIAKDYGAEDAYNAMRDVLDEIYHRAINLTPEEKIEYDKLIIDLAEARKNVPNNSWNVKNIKKWMTEKGVKFTSKDKKADLLETVSNTRGMEKKMETLEANEERFNKLDKKIIYNFPYWGDDASVYYPRDVLDPVAYNGYLTNPEGGGMDQGTMNIIQKSLMDKYGFPSVDHIDQEMLAQAVDTYLRTGGASVRGFKPGAIKGRIVDKKTKDGITDDMVEYYADPISSLLSYIHKMNESIARQKLFGKGVDIDNPNNADHVGAFVAGLVTGENEYGVKISRKDQAEIKDVFQARFANNWGVLGGGIQALKNFTYLTTLIDYMTTMIQYGDLFTGALYRGYTNPILTINAIVRAHAGQIPLVNKFLKSKIDARDYGLVRLSAEFTNDAEFLGKTLSYAFRGTWFAHIDRMGKESLVNTVISKAMKEARKGKFSSRTQILINDAFGENIDVNKALTDAKYRKSLPKEAKNLIEDLQSGRIGDSVISLAYWTLLEHQPVAESEMPAAYLRSPGMRLVYQLKTWQLKQLSLWRSEVWHMWKRGHKVQAMKNIIPMTLALILAQALPDEIRKFFQGKPVHHDSFSDEVITNMFKLMTLSKYSASKVLEGELSILVPSARIMKSVKQDVEYFNQWYKWAVDPDDPRNKAPKDIPKYALQTPQFVPGVGKQIYQGLPYPKIPRSLSELKEMVAGVPDEDTKWIVEGWRGRKMTLRRDNTYYNDLYVDRQLEGKGLNDMEKALWNRTRAEIMNIQQQEAQDHAWWREYFGDLFNPEEDMLTSPQAP